MKEYDLYSSGFLIVYILLGDTQILLRVENCARIAARRKLRAHAARQKLCAHAARPLCARMGYFPDLNLE